MHSAATSELTSNNIMKGYLRMFGSDTDLFLGAYYRGKCLQIIATQVREKGNASCVSVSTLSTRMAYA
jgi:hypothetical protein